MINPKDHVLIYRNGHVYYAGIASTIRGFSQKHISIDIFNDRYHARSFDVDRETGVSDFDGDYLHVKVVSKEEWDAAIKQKEFERGELQLRLKEQEMKEEAERDALAVTAEAWYHGLPEDQRKMIDALVHKWQWVAVA